ncbi:hypothetical protein CCH79_00011782 [Gambusia affinis]|uniref:Uncharacterized protein n=1 Tax=Gambusia affinis TaxID=33528 RepID=A0A315VNC6_GAMAF|nr:hypothetical protein CCH79_00011782 [Gambusia affinis]
MGLKDYHSPLISCRPKTVRYDGGNTVCEALHHSNVVETKTFRSNIRPAHANVAERRSESTNGRLPHYDYGTRPCSLRASPPPPSSPFSFSLGPALSVLRLFEELKTGRPRLTSAT